MKIDWIFMFALKEHEQIYTHTINGIRTETSTNFALSRKYRFFFLFFSFLSHFLSCNHFFFVFFKDFFHGLFCFFLFVLVLLLLLLLLLLLKFINIGFEGTEWPTDRRRCSPSVRVSMVLTDCCSTPNVLPWSSPDTEE